MKVDLQTFSQLHSPAYVLEELRLRKNLKLISSVAHRSDTTIILAFKAFALWKTFSIFGNTSPQQPPAHSTKQDLVTKSLAVVFIHSVPDIPMTTSLRLHIIPVILSSTL